MLELTNAGLAMGLGPETLLYEALIPSLEEVGARFERGDFFVPEMLIAGKAMAGALEILRPLLAETGAQTIGTIVMGTVKGDVHDIGKNLVNIMFEGAGFQVIDLGVQVAPEKFIEAIKEHKPDIVGFSAFLTTTMPMFKANINALQKSGLRDQVIVMVGGAPVTQEYADVVGADGYASDASAAVVRAKELLAQRRAPVERLSKQRRREATVHTILSSATKTVRIGDDQPFAIIGERINPTGRKIFQLQLRNGDLSRVEIDVKEQVAGGAMLLDVNMGAPLADEAALMTQGRHADPGADRPAAGHRLLHHRGARRRTGRLPGQGAGQLGDRRGRAAGRDPAAGQEVRRRRDRPAERRGGDPRGASPAGRAGPQAHPRRHREVQDPESRTSSSTRWPCRSARTPCTRPGRSRRSR